MKESNIEMSEEESLAIIGSICVGDRSSNREAILKYEEMAKNLPQIEIPVKHIIHGGMYARQITIPKGAIITGQIYKFEHLDIMISGDVTVSTDSGEVKRLTGYNCLEGLSGKKRAGYTHEETVWITVHPYGFGEDGEEIQEFLTANTFEDLALFESQVNQSDYYQMLNEINLTEEEVRVISDSEDDMVEMPMGYDSVYVSESNIQGNGLFSNSSLKKGDFICPTRINGKRTPAGKYTNHAMNPNAKMVICENGEVKLFAVKEIPANEEITVNYREVLQHRASEGDLCQA